MEDTKSAISMTVLANALR